MKFLIDKILKSGHPAMLMLCWVFLYSFNAIAQDIKSYAPDLNFVRTAVLEIGNDDSSNNLLKRIRDFAGSKYLPASTHITGVEASETIRTISPDELNKYNRDKVIFCDADMLLKFTAQQLAIIRCAVADGDLLVITYNDFEVIETLNPENIKVLNEILAIKPVIVKDKNEVIFPNTYNAIKSIFYQWNINELDFNANNLYQYAPIKVEKEKEIKGKFTDFKFGNGRVVIGLPGICNEIFMEVVNKNDDYFSVMPLARKAILSSNGNFERYPGGLLNENGEKCYGYKNENQLILNEKLPIETKMNAKIANVSLPALKDKYYREISAEIVVQYDENEITATLLSPFIEGEYNQKYPEPGKILWKINKNDIKSFAVYDGLLFVCNSKCDVDIYDAVTGEAVTVIKNTYHNYEFSGQITIRNLAVNIGDNTRDNAVTVLIPYHDKLNGNTGLMAIFPGFRQSILPPQMPIDKLPDDFTVIDDVNTRIVKTNIGSYFTQVIPAGNALTGLFNSWQLYSSQKVKLPLKVTWRNEIIGNMNLFPVKNPIFTDVGNNLQYFISIPGYKGDGELISCGSELILCNDKDIVCSVNCADILSDTPQIKMIATMSNKLIKWQIKDRKIRFTTKDNEQFEIIDGDKYLTAMRRIGDITEGFIQIINIVDNLVAKDVIGKRVALRKDDKVFDAGIIKEFIKFTDKAVVKLSAKTIPKDFAGAEIWINSDDISVAGGEIQLNPGLLNVDKAPVKLNAINDDDIPWCLEKNGKMDFNYSVAGNNGTIQISDEMLMKYHGQILKGKCYKKINNMLAMVDILAYVPENLKNLQKDIKPLIPEFFITDSRRIIHFNKYGKSDYQLNGYTGKGNNFSLINNIQVLSNGNLLVCDTGKSKVVEITREGELVWSYPGNVGKNIDTGIGKDFINIESVLNINSPRDAIRYEIKKNADEVKVMIDGKDISLGAAEITWQTTVIADTDNYRIVEITRPMVKLSAVSYNDNKLIMTSGYHYRPYCFYEFKGEKRYLRQTATVIADGKSLGLKKSVSFVSAQRYLLNATLPDDDIIISGVRTGMLLVANNLPVEAPDVKGKKLRLFLLKKENADKQMSLALNPYNNKFDFLPDGVETNSIRKIFVDGKNGIIIHDLNNILTLKTTDIADNPAIELKSDAKEVYYAYAPFRWYADEELKEIVSDLDGTIRIGNVKIIQENGIYPGDTLAVKYPLFIAIDWGKNE